MSDVYAFVSYAVVFNAATGSFQEVRLNSDMDMDTTATTATVDASADIQSMYLLSEEIKETEAKLASLKRGMARQVESVKAPVKGRTVKVVKGRKVPVGTVGTCFYVGQGDYGVRVGLKTPGGETLFTAASNCEAVVGC